MQYYGLWVDRKGSGVVSGERAGQEAPLPHGALEPALARGSSVRLKGEASRHGPQSLGKWPHTREVTSDGIIG
jgi:hypothetical protein